MAQESITIARPYADAVFARAKESGTLNQWSETLEFMGAVMSDPSMSGVVGNPKIDKSRLLELLFDIGGERFGVGTAGRNHRENASREARVGEDLGDKSLTLAQLGQHLLLLGQHRVDRLERPLSLAKH